MPKKKISHFVKGDKVVISQCPIYRSIHAGHPAKIIGDPVLSSDDNWVAPIKFNCYGTQYYNYPCNGMLEREGFKMKLSRPAIVTAVVLAVVGILFLWSAGNYNDLVRSRNQVNNSRAQIDTELTRRYDLVDNIVQSVQGSQAQESDVFGKIAEARKIGASSGDSTSEASQQANQTLDQQIAFLPRLQEAYPELRSNDQVTRLIQELQGTNNTIRDKRNAYNDTVTNYNNNITSFPKNIFAGIFDFDQAKLFEATKEERVNPKVELDREKN